MSIPNYTIAAMNGQRVHIHDIETNHNRTLYMASTSFKLFLLILSCEALIKIFPAPEFPGTDLLL
jgi:hypothetical protein